MKNYEEYLDSYGNRYIKNVHDETVMYHRVDVRDSLDRIPVENKAEEKEEGEVGNIKGESEVKIDSSYNVKYVGGSGYMYYDSKSESKPSPSGSRRSAGGWFGNVNQARAYAPMKDLVDEQEKLKEAEKTLSGRIAQQLYPTVEKEGIEGLAELPNPPKDAYDELLDRTRTDKAAKAARDIVKKVIPKKAMPFAGDDLPDFLRNSPFPLESVTTSKPKGKKEFNTRQSLMKLTDENGFVFIDIQHDGDIYVRGELITVDAMLVEGLRELLKRLRHIP